MRNTAKKIGIDCRMSEETGIGRYIRNLVAEISLIDTKNQYILFVNKTSSLLNAKLPENYKLVTVNIGWHGLGEQILFLIYILKQNLHLFHSPQSNMPYFYPKKFIITIHDLTILKYMTGRASTHNLLLYKFKRFVFKIFLYFSMIRATKIITVSDYVKDEILGIFPNFRNKVIRIYNGANLTISRSENLEILSTLEKFKITAPYLFYVGNAYPHKNLEKLIEAFSLFNTKNKYRLVLAGKKDFFYQRLSREFEGSKNTMFIGEVSDKELSSLYSGCALFVYPSISEGFGLQILEALKCGSNIACSGNSVFPEIAGDLVRYFDPNSIPSIIDCIKTSLRDPKAVSPGTISKLLEKFSWKKSALEHMKLYEKN